MTTDELYNKLVKVFEPGFLSLEKNNSIIVTESTANGPGDFIQLDVTSYNNKLFITDQLLKNSNNSFKGKPAPCLNEECDGIIITEFNGKNYIVLIELKSGFCNGISKGRGQLMASGIKILTFLNCIDDFSLDDYYLCAILALQKPTTEKLGQIVKKESTNIKLTGLDKLMKKVSVEDIVRDDVTTKELLFDSLPIKPNYCLPVLPLFIYTVQPDKISGAIDLTNIFVSL